MSIPMELYRYFFAVAEAGNISLAAKNLYTSQPVVSKYIQRLEKLIDTQLFVRTSRGVYLTEEGEILYEHIKKAFSFLDAGIDAIDKQHGNTTRHIRIGVSTTLCRFLLLPKLNTFIKENPSIKISINCQSTKHTVELLRDNKIDVGLIGKYNSDKDILVHDVMEINDIFVATQSYLESISFDGIENNHDIFNNATVMLLDKENITRQYIDKYFSQNNILPSNLLEISTMDLIIDFSKIGIGIGCVIEEFVKSELECGSLLKLPLPSPIPCRKVGLAVRNQNYMSDAVKLFINMFTDTM